MFKLLLFLSALTLISFPDFASACGGVEQSFWRMKSETDKEKLETFLDDYSCGSAAKYAPDRADTYIAIVLINASRARVSKDKVQAVLASFNCASSASEYDGYVEIKAYLGTERYSEACKPEILAQVYIVAAQGGANLRAEPSISAPKLGAIAEGTAVRNGNKDADWMHVDTYLGSGYMHESTLQRYLDPN